MLCVLRVRALPKLPGFNPDSAYQGESEKHNALFVFIRPREIPLASMAGELVRIQERTMASWAFWSIRCLGEHSRDCQGGNGRDGVYHQLEL